MDLALLWSAARITMMKRLMRCDIFFVQSPVYGYVKDFDERVDEVCGQQPRMDVGMVVSKKRSMSLRFTSCIVENNSPPPSNSTPKTVSMVN